MIKQCVICAFIVSNLTFATAFGAGDENANKPVKWEPVGLSGGGSMYRPSFSPVDPKFMMINSDMSCVFISRDGGHNWDMINQSQLHSSTQCYPGYHPTDASVIFTACDGIKVTRDKGVTWTKLANFPTRPLREGQTEPSARDLHGEIRLDQDMPDRMMAGDDQDVFISQDGPAS
jgi:hypothetical protein